MINLSNFLLQAASIIATAGRSFPSSVAAPTTFTPNGSHRQSSQGISVILKAICTTVAGNKIVSSLDIANLALGQTVSNINGVLTIDTS
jgi:carbohydrate-binding DOMON domain-containing protein